MHDDFTTSIDYILICIISRHSLTAYECIKLIENCQEMMKQYDSEPQHIVFTSHYLYMIETP